jgi:hypothetical protein
LAARLVLVAQANRLPRHKPPTELPLALKARSTSRNLVFENSGEAYSPYESRAEALFNAFSTYFTAKGCDLMEIGRLALLQICKRFDAPRRDASAPFFNSCLEKLKLFIQ